MFKCISDRWCVVQEDRIKKFIMDNENDVTTLPKCCPGSLAVVAEGGKAFIVNASGAWVEHGTVALSLAEEGSF